MVQKMFLLITGKWIRSWIRSGRGNILNFIKVRSLNPEILGYIGLLLWFRILCGDGRKIEGKDCNRRRLKRGKMKYSDKIYNIRNQFQFIRSCPKLLLTLSQEEIISRWEALINLIKMLFLLISKMRMMMNVECELSIIT